MGESARSVGGESGSAAWSSANVCRGKGEDRGGAEGEMGEGEGGEEEVIL